ncbi:hypothetical protein HK101_004414 [Irineochytrium annulatum]|nr:hypothetical protein HK101_004414 [Irineochytrium annulatum]
MEKPEWVGTVRELGEPGADLGKWNVGRVRETAKGEERLDAAAGRAPALGTETTASSNSAQTLMRRTLLGLVWSKTFLHTTTQLFRPTPALKLNMTTSALGEKAVSGSAVTQVAVARKLRVASLLPSATEVLHVLGAIDLMVGRSHEDDFPGTISHLPVLTGQKTTFTTSADVDRQVTEALSSEAGANASLYTLDEALLQQLEPDFIITQDICDVCAIDLNSVRRVAKRFPEGKVPKVITLNPLNLDDVLENVTEVGEALGMQEKATAALSAMRDRVARAESLALDQLRCHALNLRLPTPDSARPNVVFLEWTDPIYLGGHWTPQMIEMAGGIQRAKPSKGKEGAGKSFRELPETVINSDPDVIIVCPCGLDLETTRREAQAMMQLEWWGQLVERNQARGKKMRVVLVDGNHYFNRPGPRLVDALEFLVSYIWEKPNLMPEGFIYEEISVDGTPIVPSVECGKTAKQMREPTCDVVAAPPSTTGAATPSKNGPLVLSFTGGKDSTLTYHLLAPHRPIVRLLTFGPPLSSLKAPFLSHPLHLVRLQAEALGVPHEYVEIGMGAAFEGYVSRLTAIREELGIVGMATGDIEDVCSDFVPRVCKGSGIELVRPMFKAPRQELLAKMREGKFDILITCANVSKLGMELAEEIVGRKLDDEVVKRVMAAGSDACGEWGEFHSMVLDAPLFKRKVEVVKATKQVSDDKAFVFYHVEECRLVDK